MARRPILSLLLPALLIVAGCTHPTTDHAATTPQTPKAVYSPEAGTVATPHFAANNNLTMFDPDNGWVVDPYGVYKTTNGGKQWLSATPPLAQKEGQYRVTGSYFADRKTGWVSASLPGKKETTIYRTDDAGRTWHDATIPEDSADNGQATITFVTNTDGFMLVHRDEADVALYQTKDGGATWQKVTESGAGGLPKEGIKSGPSFRNPATGWMVVYKPQSAANTLYVTHDGGKNWQPESVALPAVPTGMVAGYQPPRFFGVSDGILPISLYPADRTTRGSTAFMVATTHDAGQSWQAGTPITNLEFIGNHHSAFSDMKTGIATDGNVLFLTTDGGKSWTQVMTRENLVPLRGVLEATVQGVESGWLVTGEGLVHGTNGLKDWQLVR